MIHVNRYLVFSGIVYYPSGGASDYDGSFDTIEEAKSFKQRRGVEWIEIFDLQTETIIWKYGEDRNGKMTWIESK